MDKIKEMLKNAETVYSSEYLTVREKEIDGERYRLIVRSVLSTRNIKIPRQEFIEYFDENSNKWIRI